MKLNISEESHYDFHMQIYIKPQEKFLLTKSKFRENRI